MEITAPFGGGSSGAAIFNQRGEVVGLVSRIDPIFRENSKPNLPREIDSEQTIDGHPFEKRFVELILRRCVSLDSIQERFAKE